VLRRSALVFDDALAALDRKLRSQQPWEAMENDLLQDTDRLDLELKEMQQTCDALENQEREDAAAEVRAQRTRLRIYASELKRIRERIRARAQRRGGGKYSRKEPGGEMEMAVALAGAHRVADELLGGSVDTADALAAQRAQLEGTWEESQEISSGLAAISSLLGTVQRSRAKQTLLLALLFGLGVCIFLYYSLRRSENVSG
jgi:hypothetical protein